MRLCLRLHCDDGLGHVGGGNAVANNVRAGASYLASHSLHRLSFWGFAEGNPSLSHVLSWIQTRLLVSSNGGSLKYPFTNPCQLSGIRSLSGPSFFPGRSLGGLRLLRTVPDLSRLETPLVCPDLDISHLLVFRSTGSFFFPAFPSCTEPFGEGSHQGFFSRSTVRILNMSL